MRNNSRRHNSPHRRQERIAGPFFPPEALRSLWANPFVRDTCASLGALVAHGGWYCQCDGIHSAAQLQCPQCGTIRDCGATALGMPVVADAHFSGASFCTAYAEARIADVVVGAAMLVPDNAGEAYEWVAKIFMVAYAMREARREWQERTGRAAH